ncbi:hypothetical protein PAXRUDRAFT_171885 [Paxillus rubicundulus Ve08.2h10]|uniref:DUF4219 domain-containing protein n=1 Tax=Paxillus rubicundulus Ve08.2h10 TaxID=930991 RepID=A0A0D0DE50_9AGAM|nr:hypothetical protein PAXRUDRAFT_171885 [Paxillus rubicundulus Ve08.2h10]
MASNSNSLIFAIPNLNGSNYLAWAPKMTNFLQASGLVWVLRKPCPEEGEEGVEQTKVNKGDDTNDHALGHILLKMDAHLSQRYQSYGTAKEVWDGLESQFAKPSLTSIYMELKAMMDTSIPEANHPAPAFAKMTAHFVCLKEFKYEIPNRIQAMIVLAKLLQYMNVVTQLLNINSDNITIKSIEQPMATMAWQQYSSRRKPNEQSTNKISTIKRKESNPQFSQHSSSLSNKGAHHQMRRRREGASAPQRDRRSKTSDTAITLQMSHPPPLLSLPCCPSPRDHPHPLLLSPSLLTHVDFHIHQGPTLWTTCLPADSVHSQSRAPPQSHPNF